MNKLIPNFQNRKNFMKKIALLCIILCACASSLNSMESSFAKASDFAQTFGKGWSTDTTKTDERGHYVGLGIEDLPRDIQGVIVSYVHTYDNPDDLIHAIKALSKINTTLQKMIYAKYGNFTNLQEFTALVHVLANKFGLGTQEIAEKFKTSIAAQYVELGDKLKRSLSASKNMYNTTEYIDEITKLIEQGADVNYFKEVNGITPLHQAVTDLKPDVVRQLLNHGANPYLKYFGLTALEWIQKIYKAKPENHQAKEILEILQKFPAT